ncbi:MAG: rod shape-determining protein MreC [Lachnospiraceae bacterium]|nr:rod shape-determining protein MreC [Lachnospiraceae bacterium]
MKRKSKFKIPSKYILLVLTVLCVGIMYVSFTMNLGGGPLNTVAGTVFGPMQRGINQVGSWITDKADNLKNLKDVTAENKELKKQINELTSELNTIKLEQYELNNLRELLDLDKQYPDYDKVAANVIGKDTGNWFSTFIIDKGSKDGIKKDANVIAGSGLVGIVIDVGPHYAKVRSIIDDISSVYGQVLSTSDNCTVNGDLQMMTESQTIKLKNLQDHDDKVKVGDQIVTSNVSSKFLQGILVGYISELKTDANNLTKSGSVTPAVDFEHLQEVLVILDTKKSWSETE